MSAVTALTGLKHNSNGNVTTGEKKNYEYMFDRIPRSKHIESRSADDEVICDGHVYVCWNWNINPSITRFARRSYHERKSTVIFESEILENDAKPQRGTELNNVERRMKLMSAADSNGLDGGNKFVGDDDFSC